MTCTELLAAVRAGVDQPEVRAHLRSCDPCLSAAVEIDPDVLFRSLGGEELEPPGGAEAFAADVMQQIRLRAAERSIAAAPRRIPFGWRWSAAAALVLGVTSAAIWHGSRPMTQVLPTTPTATVALLDRPIIESYDSADAMIIEVPAESSSDLHIVMVFDESLPADL